MINKKNYENKKIIEEDKENFINYVLEENVKYEDILNFMVYYENCNSFKDNLRKLKGGLKNAL
jgi:hypothetical protein